MTGLIAFVALLGGLAAINWGIQVAFRQFSAGFGRSARRHPGNPGGGHLVTPHVPPSGTPTGSPSWPPTAPTDRPERPLQPVG